MAPCIYGELMKDQAYLLSKISIFLNQNNRMLRAVVLFVFAHMATMSVAKEVPVCLFGH